MLFADSTNFDNFGFCPKKYKPNLRYFPTGAKDCVKKNEFEG